MTLNTKWHVFVLPMPKKKMNKKNLHTVQSRWRPGCQTSRHGWLESGIQTNHSLHVGEQRKLGCRSSPHLEPLAAGFFSNWANRTGSLYNRSVLLLWWKWIPLCGRTHNEPLALYWGTMTLIHRYTPAKKINCGILLIEHLFFFCLFFFFLSTSLTFSPTLAARGRSQSLFMHAESAVFAAQ